MKGLAGAAVALAIALVPTDAGAATSLIRCSGPMTSRFTGVLPHVEETTATDFYRLTDDPLKLELWQPDGQKFFDVCGAGCKATKAVTLYRFDEEERGASRTQLHYRSFDRNSGTFADTLIIVNDPGAGTQFEIVFLTNGTCRPATEDELKRKF